MATYKAKGVEADVWMRVVYKYLNQREIKGSKHNPVIVGFWKAAQIKGVHDDETPWCAAFVNAVFWETVEYRHAMNKSGWALDYASAKKTPGVVKVDFDEAQYGDVVALKRNGGGHVTFFLYWDEDDNAVCIGGNQSDSVKISTFPRENIKAIVRPKPPAGKVVTTSKPVAVDIDDVPGEHVEAADHDGSIATVKPPKAGPKAPVEPPKPAPAPAQEPPKAAPAPQSVTPTDIGVGAGGGGALLMGLSTGDIWVAIAAISVVVGVLAVYFIMRKKSR